MEEQRLSIETPFLKISNKNVFNSDITLNDNHFDFNINKINDSQIAFIILNKDISNYTEYKKELTLEDFKNMNKYFKIFETIDELLNDLISIIKDNNIQIGIQSENIVSIKLKLKFFSRIEDINIVSINLAKREIKEKEKINMLFEAYKKIIKKLDVKDKKIKQLENKISILNKDNETFKKNIINELNKKEQKIKLLEKEIKEIKNITKCSKKETNGNETPKSIQSENTVENILNNSTIFLDSSEILLLLSNIPKSQNNLKLIYSSKNDGENEEKLINAYTNKNDIIILVKSDKLRRFGGYAHEFFEKEDFKKSDKNAFLFNLNKKRIYNSKGNEYSIWRDSTNYDSINFGNGVDLKIYHKFLKRQSQSHQGNYDYDYKNIKDSLNADENFNVSSLEIYQVFINK